MPPATAVDHRIRTGAERRQRTRHKLLTAAFRLLAERGMDEPIIELLIRQAGVSRGTFYNHFRSERELFLAVVATLSNDVVASVDPSVRRRADPAERLACGIILSIRLVARHPVIAEFLVKGGIQAVLAGGQAGHTIARDVQAGQAAGLFSVCQSRLASDLVLGPVLCTFASLRQQAVDEAYLQALAYRILLSLGMSDEAARPIAGQAYGEPEPCSDAIFL